MTKAVSVQQRPYIYRGKYPHRIESTFSFNPAAVIKYGFRYAVRLNNGEVYGYAVLPGSAMPKCGADLSTVYLPQFLYQSPMRQAA